MARFRLMSPIAGNPPGFPYQKFKTGTVVVDTVGNAQLGDVVWPLLCSSPTLFAMAPLDAAAQALLPGNPPLYSQGIGYGSTVFGAGLDAGA
jgi:hypothetical protein